MTETMKAIEVELLLARQKHGTPIRSKHEGISVIREEYQEAEHEVFHGHRNDRLRAELVQVAAMAIRMIEDCKL